MSLPWAGVARGVFRDCDSNLVARAAVRPVLLNAMWLHVLGGEEDELSPAERTRAHLDLLMRGLAAEPL